MTQRVNHISTESPIKKVVEQIRTLISDEQLQQGDTLPSERKLAEQLKVSRKIIRDAIRKLEFYGLVKTHPQSGTKIQGKGLVALEGMIVDILDFEESDLKSFIEFRNLLEIKSAGLAAVNRTDKDIELIKEAQRSYEAKIQSNKSAENEDLKFHLQIAEVSGNSILKLMMKIITPDILKNSNWRKRNEIINPELIIQEHDDIVNQIVLKNPKEAKNAMRKHLRKTPNLQ